eukprot:2195438-Rhodomonas_salina.6
MSMQEETVALGEAITFLYFPIPTPQNALEQRAEQVESLTGNTMKDAATLIERLSRKLEESQVQRKRFQAERAILDRKFTDSLADIEVAKVCAVEFRPRGEPRAVQAAGGNGEGGKGDPRGAAAAQYSLFATTPCLEHLMLLEETNARAVSLQSKQANASLELTIRSLQQELEERASGMKDADVDLQQARLEVADPVRGIACCGCQKRDA